MKAAENLKLTRVGPGTPAGNMLRHYWWPIAVAEHLGPGPQLVVGSPGTELEFAL